MGKTVKFPMQEEKRLLERVKLGKALYSWLVYWFHAHYWADEEEGELRNDDGSVCGYWVQQKCNICAKRRIQHLEVVK